MAVFQSDEFRLAYPLLLQAVVLGGAWRFVKRRVLADRFDRLADVLLFSFLVQYLAVAVPGLLGILNPLTIAATTLALSFVLYFLPSAQPIGEAPALDPIDRHVSRAAAVFAVGYAAALAFNQRVSPVIANDALTYHFPAAVHWLQTGRLSLFETWFFNPANTYSPLAGSTFIAWWIAPAGNDVLARNVQLPALLLVFFATARLARGLGARRGVGALVALAVVLSQPFLRQSIIEKDDLYLAAFFACAVAAFTPARLRDPLGPWRVGVAVGMLLATKYTALLALPLLILLIDAPIRAGWKAKRYFTAVGVALLIAGPWYLRNALLTGNPIYPISTPLFRGLFTTARSEQFSSISAFFKALTGWDQSLPAVPFLLLALSLVLAVAICFRRVKSEPLVRTVLLGPPLMIALFFATSPYPEARFLLPAFVLLFATTALIFKGPMQFAVAVVVLVAAWVTGVPGLFVTAAIVTLIALGAIWAIERRPVLLRYGAIAAAVLLAGAVYVYWKGFVQDCRVAAVDCYRRQYGPLADVWEFVREQIPPAETVAYTNTFLIHPMSGFNDDRPLIYVPTRKNVHHLHDLPPLHQRLSGEAIIPAMAAALTAETDEPAWLANLNASGATHLVIFKGQPVGNPPESEIVAAHPARFVKVFGNSAATVYRRAH